MPRKKRSSQHNEYGLTAKEEKFCQEKVNGLSFADAYRAAFDTSNMKASTIYVKAYELVRKARITERLDSLRKMSEVRNDITRDEVIKRYKAIALFDSRKLYNEDGSLKDIHELDDETALALNGVDFSHLYSKKDQKIKSKVTRIKLSDKRAALDSISKLQGWMDERSTVTHEVKGKITHEVSTQNIDERIHDVITKTLAKLNKKPGNDKS